MRTFAQKPKATQQTRSAKSTMPGRTHFGQSREVNSILHLQRTIGNQAVQRMLETNAEELKVRLTGTSSPRFGHDFSRIPIHLPATEAIQTKLAINKPGDEYEQEADRVSEQMMRMPEPRLQRACACGGGCPKCQTEQPGQKHERLQTKRLGSNDSGQTAVPHIVHEVLRSAGQPLDPAVRAFMEPRFGHDFSRVRVHIDPLATRSARAVAAHAYTSGYNVVFGAGQYTPGTREGQRLLAHELAHVTQQEAVGNGIRYGLFRKKDEDKPQPPPPKPKTPPPTTATTPCLPKFKSLKAAITSSIGAREVNGRCELILGTPGKANGVTFTSKVDVPAGCTGTLQYVQLVDMCRSFHLASGKDIRRKSGGDYIDKQDPIDQQQVSSAGSVDFSSNDSPGQPTDPVVRGVQIKEPFKIWLMWKPDQPANANRVPLAMATWNWSLEAKVKDPEEPDCTKRWALTKQNATGGLGKATKNSPAATKTVTKDDPPIEEGKC